MMSKFNIPLVYNRASNIYYPQFIATATFDIDLASQRSSFGNFGRYMPKFKIVTQQLLPHDSFLRVSVLPS
jgi:hypothetical protein